MRIRWRGLELPNRVVGDHSTASYGRFIAEPFEQGFGATVGNSLRRVMLSSLEGSAITRVKIQGAEHEFATLPGVVEDATDLVLNIKSLVVKNHGDGVKTLRIDRHERGVVTAADVIPDDQIEILNTDHINATLTDDVPFVLELTLENGRGYQGAEVIRENEQEVGVIPVDALFSPVQRVRYKIEDTRVGQRTNYDRLTIEIWTNGTVTPEMALVESSKILRKHLTPFVGYSEPGPEVAALEEMEDAALVDTELEEKLRMSLAELNLSVRATNCLEMENINTVRDLVSRREDELLQVRNFGDTTLTEVRDRLEQIGLRLGMKVHQATGV